MGILGQKLALFASIALPSPPYTDFFRQKRIGPGLLARLTCSRHLLHTAYCILHTLLKHLALALVTHAEVCKRSYLDLVLQALISNPLVSFGQNDLPLTYTCGVAWLEQEIIAGHCSVDPTCSDGISV